MRDNAPALIENFAGPSRRPRYTVELAFDDDATDLLYLTDKPDTEAPAASVADDEVIYGVVKGISGQSQQIDPIRAVATIGAFSFEVEDYNKALTIYIRDKLAAGDGLRHKRIKLYIGLKGQIWEQYQELLTYIIDKVSYKNGVYKFRCSDIQRKERQQIFARQDRLLTKSVTATQTHIPVLTADLTEFPTVAHDAQYSDRPSQYVGYARIEDEIFSHSGLFTHGTDGTSFQVLDRGTLNTRASEHVFDASAESDRTIKIEEHIFLEGPAPKIAYALLTGDLYGQFDASSPAVQETLPDPWHLGIAQAFVRLSDFTDIDPDFWDLTNGTGRRVRINGPKPGDGKRFIEKELLLWLGCFMPIYSDGALGLRRLAPVLADSDYLVELTEANVAEYSDLQHKYEDVVNQLIIKWNHHYLDDGFTKTSVFIDSESRLIHNKAPARTFDLFAVHTGAHTDASLANYFDTLRDRYSGPPLELEVQVLPSLAAYEVGDTVKLNLSQIRDFTQPGETDMNRVYEIQRVQPNWMTGNLRWKLFGSSRKAGPLAKTALTSVLDDTFYPAIGTELSTVLTIVGGAVTANGSLTGGETLAAGCYYYLGDLTINAGVVVSIDENVQLRIRGALTVNGSIDGEGAGHPGGAGATLWADNSLTVITFAPRVHTDTNAGIGVTGYFGLTQPGGHNNETYLSPYGYYSDNPTRQGRVSVPQFNLINQSTDIDGLPTDLRGSSGSGGGAANQGINNTFTIKAVGTAGGAGGGGLMIISRGLSFGANGAINLSGDSAPVNNNYWTSRGVNRYASAGGGGAPGALVVLLDGNYTPPELTDPVTQLRGDSPFLGSRLNPEALQGEDDYAAMRGFPAYDYGSDAYTVQYIPENKTLAEEVDPPPPDVANFTAAMSGSTVVMRWDEAIDNNLDGYEIRISAQTINNFDAASALTIAAKGTRITDTAIAPGDWRLYIKAYDLAGQYSQNASTYDITVTSDFNIIESNQEHPDWLGTKTNFIKHWTGKLIPDSQDADATAVDLSTQTLYNVYDLCSYESSELDVGFDDVVRVFQDVQAELMPAQVGDVTITQSMDHRLAAGSYDGFEVWTTGEVEGRYFKFKYELDTTKGIAFISENTITADLVERVESAVNATVSITGETITFDQAYHNVPNVSVTLVGVTGVAIISNVTTTSFDVDVYNLSGTQIAGTINWTAEGV